MIELFFKVVSNLQMSIELISKLPREMLMRPFKDLSLSEMMLEMTPGNFVLIVFVHIAYIIYSYEEKKMNF